eukprot:TRINITY_DN63464_c0_g1_i1.p1 TRINITY_DN63464_c0_g1~~TRINITY_DN63464_c0_g1_i1.p1  ORF type:complete len:711 (-),score=414.30 TRINITY_DN63464_c0_g1_i1:146-2278(-)
MLRRFASPMLAGAAKRAVAARQMLTRRVPSRLMSSMTGRNGSSSSSSSAWGKVAVVTIGTALAAKLLLDDDSNDNNDNAINNINSVGEEPTSWASSFSARACGIVAYVGDDPAVDYLLEGLHILQNRGYDSAGITTVHGDELVTTKYASVGSTSDSIQLVKKHAPDRHRNDNIGIAHTRWATHGGKTDTNAHPHLDAKGRVALVHNGTIENADALRGELAKTHGIEFRSETDTEVIVQLIGVYLDQGESVVDAVKLATSRLEGTWGLAIVHKDHPNQVIAARNGSPLVVGIGKDEMFVASEVAAFSRYCNEFVDLNDGEVAVVKPGDFTLDQSRVEKAETMQIELSPAPYPHWTIKEIMEQPQAVARTLNYGGRFLSNGNVKLGGLNMNRDMLLGIRHLVIAACGTSLYAGMYGALLMRSLDSFDTVQTIDASEVQDHSLPKNQGGLLVVSQSGETKDVHRTLTSATKMGVPRFSVVNAVGSLIARTTKCGVYLNAGRENAVASTKAFTTQVTALALIAGWFAQERGVASEQTRGDLLNALHRLPTYLGMTLRTRDQMSAIAEKLKDRDHMFILGKGFAMPIALEASLKVKEITYIHAEGYGGGALKHGPFALLDNGTPVVLVIPDDQHAELMRIAAAQVRARGAYTVIVTDKPELATGIADEVVSIPSNGPLTALLAVVPLQLLAYELALKRGIDPDKPRHLAKAVTVD